MMEFGDRVSNCAECDHKLTKDGVDFPTIFKAFKFKSTKDAHDYSTPKSRPTLEPTYCEDHDGVFLDRYCSRHDSVCCPSCIPIKHPSCENVLPLKVVSRNIKKSTLLTNAIKVLSDINSTLKHLHLDREVNLKHLMETEKVILDQISELKKRILHRIDELENKLLREIGEVVKKYSVQIAREKQEICKFAQEVAEKEINIQNLSDKGNEDNLFLALRKYVQDINKIEEHVDRMLLNFKEIDLKLSESNLSTIDSLGSIVEIRKKCHVKRSINVRMEHSIDHQKNENSNEFRKENKINLVTGVNYNITDLVVTSSNKLIICNYDSEDSTIYAYSQCRNFEKALTLSGSPYGISILSEPEQTAIVTVPTEKKMYVINTTDLTIKTTLSIRERCYGITTLSNKIITGERGNVFVISRDGDIVMKIDIGDLFANCLAVLNRESDPFLLCRGKDVVKCVKLDGTLIFSYEVSGRNGLAVDERGNVYVSEYNANDVIRLSSNGKFNSVVLSKNDGINRPAAMAFNHDFSKLYIVNYDRFAVQCYVCK